MKTSFIILIVAVVVSVFPVPESAGELSGNFSVAAGLLLTDDDFAEIFGMDERFEIGVICDAKRENWPVSIVVEYFFSYGHSRTPENHNGLSENRDTDIYCSETYLGVKKKFEPDFFIRPYLAAGLYSIDMYADISYDHEYEAAVGGWYGAGAYFAISPSWQLGLEWRRSRAKLDLFGSRLDAGGDHFDLSIGYHFPR